jgi:hypothetical protein
MARVILDTNWEIQVRGAAFTQEIAKCKWMSLAMYDVHKLECPDSLSKRNFQVLRNALLYLGAVPRGQLVSEMLAIGEAASGMLAPLHITGNIKKGVEAKRLRSSSTDVDAARVAMLQSFGWKQVVSGEALEPTTDTQTFQSGFKPTPDTTPALKKRPRIQNKEAAGPRKRPKPEGRPMTEMFVAKKPGKQPKAPKVAPKPPVLPPSKPKTAPRPPVSSPKPKSPSKPKAPPNSKGALKLKPTPLPKSTPQIKTASSHKRKSIIEPTPSPNPTPNSPASSPSTIPETPPEKAHPPKKTSSRKDDTPIPEPPPKNKRKRKLSYVVDGNQLLRARPGTDDCRDTCDWLTRNLLTMGFPGAEHFAVDFFNWCAVDGYEPKSHWSQLGEIVEIFTARMKEVVAEGRLASSSSNPGRRDGL